MVYILDGSLLCDFFHVLLSCSALSPGYIFVTSQIIIIISTHKYIFRYNEKSIMKVFFLQNIQNGVQP